MALPAPEKHQSLGAALLHDIFALLSEAFAELWFKWMEWLLVVAALFALGTAVKSQPLLVLANVSGVIAAMQVAFALDARVLTLQSKVVRLKLWLRIPLWVVVMGVYLFLMWTMAHALTAALSPGAAPL